MKKLTYTEIEILKDNPHRLSYMDNLGEKKLYKNNGRKLGSYGIYGRGIQNRRNMFNCS